MKTKIDLIRTCLLVTALFQAVTSGAQSPTFTNSTYIVGSGPTYPAAADINGDGKLDLICPISVFNCTDPGNNNGSGRTLLVLTNNGGGVFGSNATLTVGNGVIDVAAADINGDGHVDLISANRGDNTLTVLTNNGNGGFGFSTNLPVGLFPNYVVSADVNGNGRLDLICANFQTNTLTVWFNNGRGGFVTNATLKVGNGPYSVAVADVNGDGYVDLITVNYGSDALAGNTLTVLTNNAAGVFGFNATLTVGNRPDCVVVADVNGDGKPDLICANWGDNSWMVLTNNGSGVFGVSSTVGNPFGGGYKPDSLVAGDFNGDGNLELICGTSGPCSGNNHTMVVLTNNGAGIIGFNATLNAGEDQNVIAADLNGDGKLDVISANYLDGTVTVLLNTSVFPAPTSIPKLTIHLEGNEVQVAWPSASTGWELQENPHLSKSIWLPSGYAGFGIADNGTNKSLTLPFPAGNLFFRLLHP